MKEDSFFESPKLVKDLRECWFYHTMEIPGYGVTKGAFDLRGSFRDYTGGVDFSEKRILEFGPANGFFSFEMEKQGADVISFDVDETIGWDIVPFSNMDIVQIQKNMMSHIDMIKNAYWFCHKAMNSRAKVIYGSIYNVPQEIGSVDIVTFGAILLHLRDPFLALQNGLRHARKTAVITEVLHKDSMDDETPYMRFLPNSQNSDQFYTWWDLPPQVLIKMLNILGFGEAFVSYHNQTLVDPDGNKEVLMPLYTIVAHRTNDQNFSDKKK